MVNPVNDKFAISVYTRAHDSLVGFPVILTQFFFKSCLFPLLSALLFCWEYWVGIIFVTVYDDT